MLTAAPAGSPALQKAGLLHAVRAAQYPGLTPTAARIMAESSPIREDASWRLARFRMPSVIDHLRLVLRSKEPMQEDAVHAELEVLKSKPTHIDYPDIHQHPLEAGPFEVVAIYSLIPPANETKPEVTRSAMQVMAQTVMSARQKVANILRRLVLFAQMAHYGWPAIVRMNAWIKSLNVAAKVCELADVYDSSMYNLQTMCVARNKQRQGLGSLVMDLAKQEVLDEQGAGMLGLCQSDATRLFYEKQGFVSRDVFTHPPSDLLQDGIRKHFLVAWDATRDKHD